MSKKLRQRILDLYAADESLLFSLLAIGFFLGLVFAGILSSL